MKIPFISILINFEPKNRNEISIGAANYGQTQQPQLSPNRNAQLSVGGPALSRGGRANIFGQQTFERRTMQALGGGPMVSLHKPLKKYILI